MIDRIQLEILSKLPAWEGHKKMAPPIRKPMPHTPKDVRYSAVCILLFYKKDELHIILIKRTEDGGTHSGQIGLPGGKLDNNDFSFSYCAIRECEEEIGLDKSRINILATISELYIPPSNFIVTPIVCSCSKVQNLIPSEDEVAEVIEVPLSELFSKESKTTTEIWRSDDKSKAMQAPIYQFREHTIWGATAMILSEFEEIYKRVV